MRSLNLVLPAAVMAVSALLGSQGRACEVAGEALVFGVVDPDRGASARADITVTCPEAQAFSVAITSSDDGATRLMQGPGTASLAYQIFTDASLSLPWGDNDSIGPTVGGTSDGILPTKLTLYGELFANQASVTPGAYSDQIVVTLTF